MRVLSTDEFVKKLMRIAEYGYVVTPTIEILPNWQLRLTIPHPDGTPFKFLGPRIENVERDDYIVFLSQVDDFAKSSLAVAYVQDLRQS